MTRFHALALSALFSVTTLSAAGAETFTQKAGVREYELANGLQLVVIPDHRSPVVTHMIWYKTGGADEQPGKSGIAHFFEHLMFKGTASHKAGEFSASVAAIGGEENAFTSFDYTAYYQKVTPAVLPQMMAFEADRMRNLILTDDVIGPERDVILEERRMRIDNNPEAVLSEEVSAALYQNHPYGTPVIGWMHEIEKLNRADAVAFYQRFYAPNNAIVVVAGDVEPEQVKIWADETYGKAAGGPALPARLRPQEPEQNTSRTVTLTDPRVSVPNFSTQWLVPSYSAKSAEPEALDMLSEILGGGIRSRLYQALVVKSGIAAGAGAYYQSTAIDDTSFMVYASPRGGAKLDDLEKAVAAEIARLIKDGVTDAELAAAKKRFIRSLVFSRDDPAGMAQIFGSTLATGGSIKDIDGWEDRINAVTGKQVQDAAAKWLDRRRSVTAYLLPEVEQAQ